MGLARASELAADERAMEQRRWEHGGWIYIGGMQNVTELNLHNYGWYATLESVVLLEQDRLPWAI